MIFVKPAEIILFNVLETVRELPYFATARVVIFRVAAAPGIAKKYL